MTNALHNTDRTDEQILSDLNHRFNLLSELTYGVCNGIFHGLIVRGEKGLGKSYTVHKILDEFDPTIAGNEQMPEERRRTVKRFTGKISPYQLFITMQQYCSDKDILLFDDCDSAWEDVSALNILKAAMNTQKPRYVTWQSSLNSRAQRENSFIFNGSIIVITNAVMMGEHMKAFLDRVHRFNLSMSPKEKILKISEIAKGQDVDPVFAEPVVDFIREHLEQIGPRLSMRTFIKTYELAKFSSHWRELARITVFHED